MTPCRGRKGGFRKAGRVAIKESKRRAKEEGEKTSYIKGQNGRQISSSNFLPDKPSPGDDFCVAVINGVPFKTQLLPFNTAIS
jgi:hypothetical protein